MTIFVLKASLKSSQFRRRDVTIRVMPKDFQMTLATNPFERYTKVTRREAFLRDMERIVQWKRLFIMVVPGKVCRIGSRLVPRSGASAVQVSRYEAQTKGPNGISQPQS